jgi:hypothetical protein
MKIPQVMDSVYALYADAKGSEKKMEMLQELKNKLFKNRASKQPNYPIDNIVNRSII